MNLFGKAGSRKFGCDEARALMFDYLDGTAGELESKRLSEHLASCADCRDELEKRKKTLNLIQNIDFPVPDALSANVMKLVETTPQDRKKRFAGLRYFPIGTVAAACAVVTIVVLAKTAPAAGLARSAAAPVMYGETNEENVAADKNSADESEGETYMFKNSSTSEAGDNSGGSENSAVEPGVQVTTTDDKIVIETSSVTMYSPNLNSTSGETGGESEIYAEVLSNVRAGNYGCAVLVCSSKAIGTAIPATELQPAQTSEGIPSISPEGVSTAIYLFKAEDSVSAKTDFDRFESLLTDNGQLCSSYVPESGFTTYFIVTCKNG